MKKSARSLQFRAALVASAVSLFSGCVQKPNAGHGDVTDWMFGRRHQEILPRTPEDSVLALAREVTVLEDELRREGTITIKHPDVWGDGNLVHYIQEHDQELSKSVKTFTQTVQAYIARGDQAEGRASAALAQGLGGASPPATPTAPLIDIADTGNFQLFKQLFEKLPAPKDAGVALEPTEVERQRSTFILVNQALRRRVSGDDNSRAAGYGLYKFRIPVSVLPGRETSEGWSGVVNLRARLVVDAANLKFTFPKLVIADVVDRLAPQIHASWTQTGAKQAAREVAAEMEDVFRHVRRLTQGDLKNTGSKKAMQRLSRLPGSEKSAEDGSNPQSLRALRDELLDVRSELLSEMSREGASRSREVQAVCDELARCADVVQESTEKLDVALASPLVVTPFSNAIPIHIQVTGESQGKESVDALRAAAREHFKILKEAGHKPSILELRAFLFGYLGQVHNVIEERGLYRDQFGILDPAMDALEQGKQLKAAAKETRRDQWISAFRQGGEDSDENMAEVSWLLAIQSATLDRNLKKILQETRLREDPSAEAGGEEEVVRFYAPEIAPQESLRLWQKIIDSEFPLYVFTLDPQIEEQNAVDAFSRRRELQIALAYALATGEMNASTSLAFSRQLSLDQETIALNRTVVGFNHGRDTFGWYFHPRIQSPPTESSNIGALARLVWSTGPTEHYDFKHRRLEPGIRECEVIVVMPSFVSQVSFDVTSNWESIPKPGKVKRSYEEMVAQGGRLYQVQCQLRELADEQCFRPGDSARLISRVEQLDQMLGMQTHHVRVPYEYEQTGTDLFDKGDVHLRPVVHDFYGLRFVEAGSSSEVHFFVLGKNFHPTLTHVILGGAEANSLSDKPQVEVVSREVLKVTVSNVNKNLSQKGAFDLRIATPAGISNVVEIPSSPAPPSAPKSDFDWADAPNFVARLCFHKRKKVEFVIEGPEQDLVIKRNKSLPLRGKADGQLQIVLVGKDASGKEYPLPAVTESVKWNTQNSSFNVEWSNSDGIREKIIESVTHPSRGVQPSQNVTEIVGTVWIHFDDWLPIRLDTPIKISIQATRLPDCDCDDNKKP